MLWIPPQIFPPASAVSPAHWMGCAVWLGLPLSARTSTCAAVVSRAHALRSPVRQMLPAATRGRSGPGWPRLQIPEGNGVGTAAVTYGICGPEKEIGNYKASERYLFPACLSAGFRCPGRPGQFLWRPGTKGGQVGGRAVSFRFRRVKGKHSVNTGPGEWWSSNRGLRWPWRKPEEEEENEAGGSCG